ncbi:MAG: DUF4397 domain-containing protein [Gemmatimonadaceae bacterium]|nr:DUF4397 domain-containing protein [Gemmatimonadaceae bacterium]
MKKYLTLAGLLCASALSACEKNAVQDITGTAPASRIKFFNFGVCTVTATPTTSCMPNVNFYANDTKMTATTSATGSESVVGVVYGGVGSGGLYSGIAPGQYTITGKISAATDKDVSVSPLPTTIADGKFYSYYISGFYNTTTKVAESFVVEDAFPALDLTVPATNAYVRFVNAISNSSPMVLNAKSTVTGTTTAVGSAVAYKTGGGFTALPGGRYDITTRVTGASTDAITRLDVSFSAGRIYTVTSRGDITIVSTTAINRPFLDNTLNR